MNGIKCKDLKALHLYENKLESIDLSILSKCKKLRNLTLEKNQFETIDVSALFLCPNLMKLGLDSELKITAEAKLKKQAKIPIALKTYLSRIEWY